MTLVWVNMVDWSLTSMIRFLLKDPSSILAELDQFIEEFTLVAHNLQEKSSKSYLCKDYNINLLRIDSSQHYSRFFENMTTLGFSPKLLDQ